MFDKIKDTFLLLLRAGLWEKSPETLSNFPLTEEEWSLIYEVSVGQTVEGIVYEGIMLIPSAYYPPMPLLLRWTAKIDAIERYNQKVRSSLSVLAKGFSKNGIEFVLLKGLGFANNYPKPLLRVSGDIDLYFNNPKSYKSAKELLIKKGCKVHKGDHNSIYYLFNSVDIEHHTKMIDIFNPFCQKYIRDLIENQIQHQQKINFNGQDVAVPSKLINLIQGNAHILKHYMGFGVGLRQLCDIARLYYVKEEGFENAVLKDAYFKLGMNKWMDLVHSLLIDHLGLNPSYLPYEKKENCNSDFLLNDILASGNFGFHDTRFRKDDALISERYYKRDNVFKRVIPHIIKLIKIAPNEVVWYPINKVSTKLFDR